MEWQPIETAPQDGTAVLIWANDGVWIAEYYKPWKGWMHADCPISPTHWQPLPEPPQ